jgi:hypothetical protein
MSQVRGRQYLLYAGAPLVVRRTATQGHTVPQFALFCGDRLRRGLVVLLVALSPIGTTCAQTYPTKPVKLSLASSPKTRASPLRFFIFEKTPSNSSGTRTSKFCSPTFNEFAAARTGPSLWAAPRKKQR